MVSRRQLLKLSALGTATFAAPLAYSASNTTMTHKNGSPLGSPSLKDVDDNARSLDLLVCGESPTYMDRRGVQRRSWAGMEGEFSAEQIARKKQFDVFLNSSGFEAPMPYEAGIELIRITQTVTYDKNDYRAKSEALPFTTSDWATDVSKLVLIGDDSLRQDVANSNDPTKGANLVGFVQSGANAKGRTLLEKIREFVTVKDFGAIGDGVIDDTVAVQAALNFGGNIYFPPGVYCIKESLVMSVPNTQIKGSGEGYIGTQIKTLPDFAGEYMFQVNAYGAIFDGLMLAGDGLTRGVGAKISGANFDRADSAADIDCFIKNCTFSNFNTCIRAVGKNISIRDSLFGQSKRAITFNQRAGIACYGVRIERNRFHGIGGADYKGSVDNDPCVVGDNPGYCIDARGTGDITFTQIVENYADTSGSFFIGRLPHGTIAGNIIKDAWSCAIQVESSSHVNISNNQIRSGFSSKDTGCGICISSLVSMSKIEGNVISGFSRHGIYIESGSQNIINSNMVVDNNFAGYGEYDGINIALGAVSNLVTGNVVRSTLGEEKGHRYGVFNSGVGCYFDGNLIQSSIKSNFYDESSTSLGLTQSVTESRRTVYGDSIPTTGHWSKGDRVLAANPIPGGIAGYICTASGNAESTAVFKPLGMIGT